MFFFLYRCINPLRNLEGLSLSDSINKTKWIAYEYANKDKEKAKKVWNMVFNRLDCNSWSNEWSAEQEQEFTMNLNRLLPPTVPVIQLIREVFPDAVEI